MQVIGFGAWVLCLGVCRAFRYGVWGRLGLRVMQLKVEASGSNVHGLVNLVQVGRVPHCRCPDAWEHGHLANTLGIAWNVVLLIHECI